MHDVKRLFWDVETSPNLVMAWRAGYDLTITPESIVKERKIICIGYRWEGESKTHVLMWDKLQDDRQMLKDFVEIANQADEMIFHNGDRFDLPWLKARCVIHGLKPLPSYKTIDTKAWSSRNFYFNSNRLDYIGKILGFGGKIHTGLDLWRDVVLDNDRSALMKMAVYCKRDVELLQKVYNRLSAYMVSKTHAGVAKGNPRWSCSHCGSVDVKKDKTRINKSGIVSHQMKCGSCGGYHAIPQRVYEEYTKRDSKTKQTVLPRLHKRTA